MRHIGVAGWQVPVIAHALPDLADVIEPWSPPQRHWAVKVLGEGDQLADVDPDRAAAATAYGADVTLTSGPDTAAQVLELTRGLGADVVIDFVGIDATLRTAIGAVRTYGSIVTVGVGGGTLPFTTGGRARVDGPPWGVRIVRPYGATMADVFDVIALAQTGRIKAEVEQYPLADAPEVLERLRRGEVHGRAVLRPYAWPAIRSVPVG